MTRAADAVHIQTDQDRPAAGDAASTRRVFVHLAGYYPLAPEANKRRFEREHRRFLNAWSLSGAFGPMTTTADWARWSIITHGQGWTSDVDHLLFRWEDIIEADRSRNWITRVGLSILTFLDFVINGALFRYLRHAWRYAGFFLYPFLWLAAFCAISIWGVRWGMHVAGLAPDWRVALIAALLPFFGLLHAFGKPLKLDHLLDDWIYGRSIVRRADAAVEERLLRLAMHLNADDREVLIVGHSFGAIYGARLVALMLEHKPDGPPIRFATVGSSILKIAFNGAARHLKQDVSAVATASRVIWHDFTALNDVMNFHLVEPVGALGVAGTPAHARRVRFRGMVAPEYYARMERNFFRLHNQFISGNDFRASYDYFMLMCGPWPMDVQSHSAEGAMHWIDQNGGLTEQGQAMQATGVTAR